MLNGQTFKNSAEFIEWYRSLNPNEPIDMQEAMLIYFHLDTYGETI